MKKEYIFPGDFALTATENNNFAAFDLSIAAALMLGAQLVEITAAGDALLQMSNDARIFVSTAKDTATLSQRSKEYEANWFCPFSSKPIAQELMRRYPMVIAGQPFRYGALNVEWVVESNTVFAAGDVRMAGIQHGRDAWCLTASENALEAITLNALMQAGCNRHAVFYFPNGPASAQLIYVTPESAHAIADDKQLSAVCVFTPSLDKYAVIGAPEGEYQFELENAKLQWQIQIARWSRETGQPVPAFDEAPEVAPAAVESEQEGAEEAEEVAQNEK